MLRRAALVHDIGMIGIPSAVWDEAGGIRGPGDGVAGVLDRVRLTAVG
jgi:hypothetical protein